VLALVIGGGAGWLDRRGGDSQPSPTSGKRPGAGPDTSKRPPAPSTNPSSEDVGIVESFDTEAIAALDPAIGELGHRYLTSNPSEASLTVLIGLLVDQSGDRSATLDDPKFDPIVAAASVIAREFERGDTVSVAGWVLAVSEARAAAVVALVCVAAGQESTGSDSSLAGADTC